MQTLVQNSIDTRIHEVLSDYFEKIHLEEMDQVKLMNRCDTKTYFNLQLLPRILKELSRDYYVLEVKGNRMSAYDSLYYDTKNLDLYQRHHNRHLNRYKIRYRQYIESNLTFFEIKFKSNKGRTIKKRIVCDDIPGELGIMESCFLDKNSSLDPNTLKPALRVLFDRITLVSKDFKERATLDLGLSYESEEVQKEYDSIVIAEIKQSRFDRNSSLIKTLRKYHIFPEKISKYCTGIVNCYPSVRANYFKEKIRRFEKVNNQSLMKVIH